MNSSLPTFALVSCSCLIGLVTSGCLNLKPASDPSRHFVLSYLPMEEEALDRRGQGLGVGVRAVTLPSHLEKDSLAVRKGMNEIEYLEWSLWAEPLERGLIRVLGADLGRLLQSDQIYLLDWSREDVRFELECQVARFEPDRQGMVALEVSWRISVPGTRQVLRSGRSSFQKQGPPPADDPGGTVAAMSALVAEFSREMASLLRELAPS